jgi:hypothetical protein
VTATLSTRCRRRVRSQKHASAPRRFCTRPAAGPQSRFRPPTLGERRSGAVGRGGRSIFLNIDPLVSVTGEPYAYAGDDPVNESDPTGLIGGGKDTVNQCYGSQANTPQCHVDVLGAIGNGAATAWNATGGQVVHTVATHTIGLCLNGSAGFGVFGEADGCIALVGGKPTLVGTLGGGGGSPGASLTGGFMFSNAHNSGELGKWFGFAGGSADLGASVGDQVSFGEGDCNRSIWENETTAGIGLDLPIPFEYHGGASYTWTWSPW